MLSKRYESTEVGRRTWLHVPSGTHWCTSSDTHQVNHMHTCQRLVWCTIKKGRDLTQSYDKSPTPTEKFQKATWKHKNATKNSITQRLRTDLGRSVGVTIATQLVWLNQLKGSQPSHSPQQLCDRGHKHAGVIGTLYSFNFGIEE